MPCTIPLTQGKKAIVDAEDWLELSHYRWQATTKGGKTWYAKRRDIATGKQISMHRQITGALPGEDVDHLNADGLDNQRSNLRRCSHQENTARRRKLKPSTSAYKGVTKGGYRWRAQLFPRGKHIDLGYFKDEVEAAKAYDAEARKHYGEFALLNFPDGN